MRRPQGANIPKQDTRKNENDMTTNVTGQTTYNFDEDSQERTPFLPPEPKEWDAICRMKKVEIKPPSAQNPESVPWIGGSEFELSDSAPNENAKNMRIRHGFFLKVAPDSNGNFPQKQKGALLNFMEGLGIPKGERPKFGTKMQPTRTAGKSHEILSPEQVKAWLVEQDGKPVRLKSRIRTDPKDSNKQYGEVEFFVVAENLFAAANDAPPPEEPAADEAPGEEEAPKPAPKKSGKKK